jgi:phosphoserine phosphatase
MPPPMNNPMKEMSPKMTADSGSTDNGWVITVIGRSEVESAFGAVVDVIKEQGLEFDKIELLSGAQVPSLKRGEGYACAAIHCHAIEVDENALRAACRKVADDQSKDIVVQRRPDQQRPKKMFFFDMDSTLIQGETIDELAKMAGVGDQVRAVTAAAMRGELAFPESFRHRVALLKGLPEDRVLEALDRIPLMEGSERLFRTLRHLGIRTGVLSGGFTFFGDHLQKKLGVDFVHANVLDVADGVVTGAVRTRIVDGAYKAELLQQIAAHEGVPLSQVVAVGDGANDLPMLRLAGLGVAFHAKPVVRAEAKAAMTHVGLDGLLYLSGIPDWEWV